MSNRRVDLVMNITFVNGDMHTLYKKAKDLTIANEK